LPLQVDGLAGLTPSGPEHEKPGQHWNPVRPQHWLLLRLQVGAGGVTPFQKLAQSRSLLQGGTQPPPEPVPKVMAGSHWYPDWQLPGLQPSMQMPTQKEPDEHGEVVKLHGSVQ
jgi:hypothetical protein